MMRFSVPQFIEKEVPLFGPFTFRQLIFLSIAGGICLILYFLIGQRDFFLFLLISLIIIGIFVFFTLGQIKGKNAFSFLVSSIVFLLKPKKYLWQRKEGPVVKLKIKSLEKDFEERNLIQKIKNLRKMY